MRWGIAGLALLALLVTGCQESGESQAEVSEYKKLRSDLVQKMDKNKRAKRRKAIAQVQEEGTFTMVDGAYRYDPTGKKDPFRSFVLDRLAELEGGSKGPLEQFELSQLSVTGVIWQDARRRALVEDPSGRGYIVQSGTIIGKNDGHVVQIDDNLVLVRETYVDYVGDKTTKDIPMRVRQGQGG